MGLRPRLLLKLSVLCLSILLALAALEIGLRVSGYDPNESNDWRFHPVFGWTIDPVKSGLDQVNRDGFRYRAAERQKTDGTRRVLVVGDSFTAGTNLPYSATYPAILEAELNQIESQVKWQVISLAVNDWGSAQQLLALETYGLEFHPDAVVFQVFPFNDFCNNTLELAYSCSLQDAHRPYFQLEGETLRLTYLSPWRSHLRNAFHLFGWLENRLDPQMGILPPKWQKGEENLDLQRRAFFRYNASRFGLEYEGAVWSLIPDNLQPDLIVHSWSTTHEIIRQVYRVSEQQAISLIPLVIPFSKTLDDEWDSVREILDAPMVPDFGTGKFEDMFRSVGAEPVSMREEVLRGPMLPQDYFISPSDGHLNSYGHSECTRWILNQMIVRGLVASAKRGTTPADADLISNEFSPGLLVRGLSGPKSSPDSIYRTLGTDEASVVFGSDSTSVFSLRMSFESGVEGLALKILINGENEIKSTRLAKAGKWTHTVLDNMRIGRNEIRFSIQPEDETEDLKQDSIGRFTELKVLVGD